ncbi:reverse transcriptase family protein [Stenotrophomonas sp.]|uniref:reverse transcriptase family protein n=1 Tax=Stenotrophomonas sp. TaxID=69392 RepID=UPI00289A48F8|nr:reverse transcriptase family protein [Stenotrophomonas sp.]
MRLPHLLQESPYFVFSSVEELLGALGPSTPESDKDEIVRLVSLGLSPVLDRDVLAVMLGINPGLIWSFEFRPNKHYRVFSIRKGARGWREIVAPKVALKVLQKWLSISIQRSYVAPVHVFGFVPGRSHIDAAKVHAGASWTFSVDIENFFSATPMRVVREVFERLGYGPDSAAMLARLCCYRGFLAQGAPTSPVISNIALTDVDGRLSEISRRFGVRLSRYADDVVFSGIGEFPVGLRAELDTILADTPWAFARDKTELNELPGRLKVHGLLVHGAQVRLTKGYRNRLRAYSHLARLGRVREADKLKVQGHLRYSEQVREAAD